MPDRTTQAAPLRIAAVSFLNARPLIAGLDREPRVALTTDVPARLADRLDTQAADAALVPVVDLAAASGAWDIVSDACIGCDGETLTVRVFSHVPPEAVRVIHADTHSHTSVVLARLIWARHYGRSVDVIPTDMAGRPADCETLLLIGDKVVTSRPAGFAHELDLGSAWKQWTGLPFAFAVWAARPEADTPALDRVLRAARDRGVAAAAALARHHGPPLGWPVELAVAYLTRHMQYTLTPAAREGMRRFVSLARAEGLIDVAAKQVSP
jgi:chorismate dehydratase